MILIAIPCFAQTKPTIAVLYTKSGEQAEEFENLTDATRFAIAQYNQINKSQLDFNIVEIDDKDSPDVAEKALKDLIKKEKVVAILGPTYSNVALSLKNFVNENKIPMISIFATHNYLTKNAAYVLRICASNKRLVKMMGEHLVPQITKNKLNVTVFKDLSDFYSTDLADSFKLSLMETKASINEVLFRGLNGLERLRDINSKVWSPNKKDVLILTTQDIVASHILAAMETEPYLVATIDPVNFEGLYKKSKKVRTHIRMVSTAQWLPGKSEFSKKIESSFLKQYKTEIKIPSALTFDAAYVFLSAFERSEKKKIPLIEALKDGTKVQGLTGDLALGPDGERINTNSFIKEDILK
jgi:ABC-type branched-subunit amino acid transport system substrate-binding protein